MKGVYELQTPMPRYQHTWNVLIVLNYFKTLEQNEDLSLKDLTKKLCALLLLITAQRVQTLHISSLHIVMCRLEMIKLSCVHVHDKGCTIQIVDKVRIVVEECLVGCRHSKLCTS